MKNSKKRMLPMILLLVLVLAFLVAACRGNETDAGTKTNEPTTTSAEAKSEAAGETESEAVSETEGEAESEAESSSDGIMEDEGEIVIEVPEDEDTFGE